MANLFGAIDVGSHEMELKIFELSKKNGIRQVDDIIHLIDLGTDTYNDGRISSTWGRIPIMTAGSVSHMSPR